MPLVQITDHAAQAEALLLGQYQGKPRIRALLLSYVNRCQEFENAVWNVIVRRLIDNAENAQLDAIGQIVGELRNGKADAVYRVYVTARIRINRSHGHPRDVIEVLRIVEPAAFRYIDYFPASFDLEYSVPPAADPSDLAALAQQARSAGIRLGLVASTLADTDSIMFGQAEGETPASQGLADDAETVGGVLSHIYE